MKKPSLRGLCLFLVLVAVLALFGFVATCGQVHSSEYSPQTFKHRSRTYYQIPLAEIQVTPGVTEEWTTPLATYLEAEGFLTPLGPDPDWAFIKGFTWGIRGWSGSAKYLCHDLGCWGGDDQRWVTWSKDHPDVAKELWPIVVGAARSREFSKACTALSAAEHANSLEQFRRVLKLLRTR